MKIEQIEPNKFVITTHNREETDTVLWGFSNQTVTGALQGDSMDKLTMLRTALTFMEEAQCEVRGGPRARQWDDHREQEFNYEVTAWGLDGSMASGVSGYGETILEAVLDAKRELDERNARKRDRAAGSDAG